MKLRLLAALFTLSTTASYAQNVDVDVSADTEAEVAVPGMKVKMRVDPGPAPGAVTATPPRSRGPRPPPVQVVGVDTFDVRFELSPSNTIRLVSPEGAHADVWADDGAYLGAFDLPCEVPARAGQFYRVVMTLNGGLVFDRKVEVRPYNRTIVLFRGAVLVPPPPIAIGMVDFPALLEAVNAENFADAKLDVVKTSEGGFTVEQVGALVDAFNFSDEKLKVVEICQPRIVDRQNLFKLSGHFTFDSDKKKLKTLLGK